MTGWLLFYLYVKYAKLKPFLLVFIDVTSKTLSFHIMFSDHFRFGFTINQLVFENGSGVNKTVK